MTPLKTKRISVIDALRGLSLFGILITHCLTQFLGVLPETQVTILTTSIVDKIFAYFLGFFVGGKFFLIFSLLFGIGFSIQFEKGKGDRKFNLRFIWRMFLLGIFGLGHYLFFQGDILIIYAILGVLLLYINKLSNKSILVLIGLLISGIPRSILLGYHKFQGTAVLFAKNLNPESIFEANFNISTTAPLLKLMEYNLDNWIKMVSVFQIGYFGRAYQILAIFSLGLLLGRIKYFKAPFQYEEVTRKSSKFFFMGSILSLLCQVGIYFSIDEIQFHSWATIIGITLYDLFNLTFAGFIVTRFVLFHQNSTQTRLMEQFEVIGRMSLTIYIMQSLIFTPLYFFWGLNLFGQFGVVFSVMLGVFVFIFQIIFASIWLRHFKMGPFEWLWRSLTHLKLH